MTRASNSERRVGVFQNAPVETKHSTFEFHLGTNSLMIVSVLAVVLCVAYIRNVFDPIYLKGLDHDLLFSGAFVSIVLGVGCYEFWKLGMRSVYSFHFLLSRAQTRDMIELFSIRDYSFSIGRNLLYRQHELPAIVRKLGCIAVFLLLAVVTIDNRGFVKLKEAPFSLLSSHTDYCPEKAADAVSAQSVEPGCELVIRAYELGYSKELGACAPKTITPEQLSVCDKRRKDEPYLHYASRLLSDAIQKMTRIFSADEFEKVEKKFKLQWQQVENLRDYQLYAMSAAPRASHHIWTNLPSPNSDLQQAFIDVFRPNYCLQRFQNQTNTVAVDNDNPRTSGRLLEHVYGQLLFNPKVKRTVGLCKEYQVHWESEPDICEQLANQPIEVLAEYKVLSDVQLVLKRHDIAQSITQLDEKLLTLETEVSSEVQHGMNLDHADNEEQTNSLPSSKKLIDKSKIAKNKRFREKNEIVSFSCYMMGNKTASQEENFQLHNTDFKVRSFEFPPAATASESQIAMYQHFAKALDREFHYTQLSSRSDLELPSNVRSSNEAGEGQDTQVREVVDQQEFLQYNSYMLSRLELLNNIDIFLGNDWVLEREDLLEVYPYHVHLQNYVESFRVEYQQDHGRL